jgi:hypothetical protein
MLIIKYYVFMLKMFPHLKYFVKKSYEYPNRDDSIKKKYHPKLTIILKQGA